MAEALPAYDERPRRRGRKVLIALVVLLLVLVGIAVVADRVAAGVAERAIADQVRQEVANQDARSAAPEVEIGGFPFLTQVLAGRYERISIGLRDVRASVRGDEVTLPELDVDARDVRAPLETLRTRQGDVVAESVDGRGIVTYDSLAKLLDRPGLKLGERDGRLAVTAPVEILGEKLTVTGTADLTVGEEGEVSLRFADLNAEGLPRSPLARALLNDYARSISVDVPLQDLPLRLKVREVTPLPSGLEVTVGAKEVPLNAAG